MKKRLFLLVLVALSLYIVFIWNSYQSDIVMPSECSEELYTTDNIKLLNKKFNLEHLNRELNTSILKNDYRFVGFLGLGYTFPGLSLEKDEKLIKKYGVKIICVSDVSSEEYNRLMQNIYHYYMQYNQLLLKRIKK